MRLLELKDDGTFALTRRFYRERPAYAILSHTWSENEDDEVSFSDLMHGTGKDKPGYQKLLFCAEKCLLYGVKYFWVDTCCFDKDSSAELQEAITSMFRWYSEAVVCFVYLEDMVGLRMKNCRWFRRGWTLQELLAPKNVFFFSPKRYLGTKEGLAPVISDITDIPVEALCGCPLAEFSIEERLSWAADRETRREEDLAYCLLGILGIYLIVNYGEGENAHDRLIEEIERRTCAEGRAFARTDSPAIKSSPGGPHVVYSNTNSGSEQEGRASHIWSRYLRRQNAESSGFHSSHEYGTRTRDSDGPLVSDDLDDEQDWFDEYSPASSEYSESLLDDSDYPESKRYRALSTLRYAAESAVALASTVGFRRHLRLSTQS